MLSYAKSTVILFVNLCEIWRLDVTYCNIHKAHPFTLSGPLKAVAILTCADWLICAYVTLLTWSSVNISMLLWQSLWIILNCHTFECTFLIAFLRGLPYSPYFQYLWLHCRCSVTWDASFTSLCWWIRPMLLHGVLNVGHQFSGRIFTVHYYEDL